MKKSKKTIGPRKDRVALVVGEDLQVAQIADLHGRAIVQKFVGRVISSNKLVDFCFLR